MVPLVEFIEHILVVCLSLSILDTIPTHMPPFSNTVETVLALVWKLFVFYFTNHY